MLLRAVADGNRVLAPVRDPAKLRRQLESESLPPDAVVPLPADPSAWNGHRPTHAVLSAGVLFSREKRDYFDTNVDWNLRVLATLPESCSTIVLSSQSAGGPTPPARHARVESDPDQPLTWYGKSKLELERRLAADFPRRRLAVLRPPIILGARDSATLPLFKMAAGAIRPKPGLRPKEYSFLAVEDVVEAIEAAFLLEERGPFYIASEKTITDLELIETAAGSVGARGITLPLPHAVIRLFSMVVDAVPAFAASAPSLTRDRVREIWPDRWVVDPSDFRRRTGWRCRVGLGHALQAAHDFLAREGRLPRPRGWR